MDYEKYDIITFEEDDKVIVLETLDYNGSTYLYVDKIDEKEENTLKKFHILRVEEDGYLEKEIDTNILMEIVQLFKKKIDIED